MGRAEETLLQCLSRTPCRTGVPPQRLTTWPYIHWANAKRDTERGTERDQGANNGRNKMRVVPRCLPSYITLRPTLKNVHTCKYMQTHACTDTHFRAADFAQHHLLTDVMIQPLRYSLLSMRHSCSTYHSLLLAKGCRLMLSQRHAALSVCGWK